MRLVDDPDERLFFPSAACRGCGEGLAGEPAVAQRRHQVTDIALIGASGSADRVRELLRDAPAVHADETPARAAIRSVTDLACTLNHRGQQQCGRCG